MIARSRTVRAQRLARDRPRTRPGDHVGHGLVGERLRLLVVADQAVEPLMGRLVVDEVGQVPAGGLLSGPR